MSHDRTVAHLDQTPELETDALPTVLVPRYERSVSPERAPTTKGPVKVVAGTGPRLSAESDELKQRRLRAATVFFLASVSVLLVWRLTAAVNKGLWPLHLCVIMALGSLYLFLSDPRPLSQRRLTALEVATFGVMSAFLAIRQYDAMMQALKSELVSTIQLAYRSSLMGELILIFAYSMLMPNTWRRSARFVIAMIAVPSLTQAIVYLSHPELFQRVLTLGDFGIYSENLILSFLGACLAIFGTHVVNTLRAEVFQARELNQYKLGEPLGGGGMGEVYHAEHRMLKRPCAIKLIRGDRANDAAAIARFEREVRATARLSHPNTIEIYDYGHTDDGRFYYVMELLKGLSLAEIVEQHGPLPPARVVYLLKAACEALGEAHANGLIHRDLKPANIFSARKGGHYDTAKLLDFGLVKGGEEQGSAELSRDGTVRGTPMYMAPEQATGQNDLDHRCDLYAMGGVAYYLLTGRPPFDGGTAAEVMIAHVRDPVVPPSTINPAIPKDLERVILKCLAKRREDRYQNAEELAQALGACECATEWDARKASDWWDRIEGPAS